MNAVELLRRMVERYSPTGQEGPLAAWLAEELDRRGFAVEQDGVGNVVARIGRGPKKAYLVGHLDTVPGEPPVEIRDGKLYGRGSVDAKGPLAAFIAAASELPKGLEVEVEVWVIAAVDEEGDSRGARHLLGTLPPPDLLVIGEPSGWQGITLGYKGSLNFTYEREVALAHRSAGGATAAERACAFFEALRARYPRDQGFSSVDVRLVSMATRRADFCERASLGFNVRTPPGFSVEGFKAEVEALDPQACLLWGEAVPAHLSGKNTPLSRSFLGAIRAEGGRPVFKRKTGTSDMNLLAPGWGVPAVAYGPGDSRLDHTPHEHLDLAEYRRAIRVLRGALARWSGSESRSEPGGSGGLRPD